MLLIFIMSAIRVVKLTSPTLNYFIILGTLLFMLGNVFFVYLSQNPSKIAIFCEVS